MNPITMLEDDHRKVSRLFEEHERAAADRKRGLFERINTELSVHAEIEEQVFYPAVREASPKGAETVKEGYEEHAEVKALLAELSAMDVGDEDYEAKIAELRKGVEHHVEEEEGEMLPEAERALGERLQSVGDRMQEMKQSLLGGAVGAAKAARGTGGGTSRSRSSSAGSRSTGSRSGSRGATSRRGGSTGGTRSAAGRGRSTGSRATGAGGGARKTSGRTGGRSSTARSKGSRTASRGGSRSGSRSRGRR